MLNIKKKQTFEEKKNSWTSDKKKPVTNNLFMYAIYAEKSGFKNHLNLIIV